MVVNPDAQRTVFILQKSRTGPVGFLWCPGAPRSRLPHNYASPSAVALRINDLHRNQPG
jgi:hypothetical protein